MECLDPELIERYVHDTLPQDLRLLIDTHIEICYACKQAIDIATKNESILNDLQTHSVSTVSYVSRQRPVSQTAITVDHAQAILRDQYKVVKKIGEGSFGEVFLAVDPALDRSVAVKFLRQKLSISPGDKGQGQEGKFMSRVNHPHVAHIYHIGEYEGLSYIVMELIEGIPLTKAWEKESLSKRLKLYLQVLEAIDTAHQKGIVHRDIKPSNILVTAASDVKVLDFGIALAVHCGQIENSNVYRGTPSYSAPEQITHPEAICLATDVFALGILLYELLTDALPFPQNNKQDLFEAICHQHPELPSAIQESIPLPLQNICLKALEKDIANRYPDVHALMNDILRYVRGEKVWARPSFVNNQVQQELFYHRQRLDIWHNNGLITEKEHDQLETVYARLSAPADPSIIEARKLSFSQVCLYLGGWVVVLGCAVLLSSNWGNIDKIFRPLPAILSVFLVLLCGKYLWTMNETRLSVGFLATGCLLLPMAMLLTLGHYQLFNPDLYKLGEESLSNLPFVGIHIGNLQLLLATGIWLITSLFFVRKIRSSIFVIFSVISFLGLLSTCFVIEGMIGEQKWRIDIIAGRYLFVGVGFFVLGLILDRHKLTKYAWPLSGVGCILIVLCLTYISISKATLFGWLYPGTGILPEWEQRFLGRIFQNKNEVKSLSIFCSGLIYFGLAWVCRHQGTRLHRTLGNIFNWLGPLFILGAIRASEHFVTGDVRPLVYRIALPVASLLFIFSSVTRQMKSFVLSGLSGMAVSIHEFTFKNFEDSFSWPIILILLGLLFMLFSCWLPHLEARKVLERD